jgi:NAD(P)-dependent dehydrogenase (short-subunit alcohol dehydrogenase family)
LPVRWSSSPARPPGIGKACVDAFLRRGAAVIALDLNPAVEAQWKRPDVLGLQCDLTIVGEVRDCLDRAIRRFGGVDMLVLNAGIFPASARSRTSRATHGARR